MLQGVDINEVRKYNASLKQYKDQSARLSVEIEMNEKELTQICEQLSKELNIAVTPENVEEIYKEQVNKINQTLETGNAILKKIEQEASGVKQGTVPTTPVQQTVQPTAPVQPVQPTAQQTVQQTVPMQPAAPVQPTAPVQPVQPTAPLFTGQTLGNVDKLPQPNAGAMNSGTPFFTL